ncbi:MAG: phasin family protein [Alphaproteobacteria bacterium]
MADKTRETMENTFEKGRNQAEKVSQDAAAMSRESMDAFMKSSGIFVKGLEEIIRTSMSLAQNSAEKQAQFIKQAMSSKTLNEWSEAQNKIAQANFDDFMSGATKISELSVRLLTTATEPLSNQAAKTVKKATDSIAA